MVVNSQEKIGLVTGATNGMGKSTALGLARAGFSVIIVGRDAKKCEDSLQELITKSGNQRIRSMQADLSLQADVRRLSDQLHAEVDGIDVLVNNAGGLAKQRHLTADGIEYTLALNHLAPFLLTNLVLDRMRPAGRIVNVSSMVHSFASINFEDMQLSKKYSNMAAYANAKFMMILTSLAQAPKLAAQKVTVNLISPPFVATRPASGFIEGLMFKLMATNPDKGAETALYLALNSAVEGKTGGYYAKKQLKSPRKKAFDQSLQQRAWAISEQLTQMEKQPHAV